MWLGHRQMYCGTKGAGWEWGLTSDPDLVQFIGLNILLFIHPCRGRSFFVPEAPTGHRSEGIPRSIQNTKDLEAQQESKPEAEAGGWSASLRRTSLRGTFQVIQDYRARSGWRKGGVGKARRARGRRKKAGAPIDLGEFLAHPWEDERTCSRYSDIFRRVRRHR